MDDQLSNVMQRMQDISNGMQTAVDELNNILQMASDLGLYVLIDKEEERVNGKNNRIKLSIRKISFTTDFVSADHKPGGSEGMGPIHF